MAHVMACIDGSRNALAVCDYAAWAGKRIDAPLECLHVLGKSGYPVPADFSGSIGLGSREHPLQELAELDEKRGRLALEEGRLMLESARAWAIAAGVESPTVRQRHGEWVDTLKELENDIRLLVIGRQGGYIGSQLENVVRTLHRPILVIPADYREPQRILIAFDGSATMRQGVERVATSPLFRGLACHVVGVGANQDALSAQLEWARATLASAGHTVTAHLRSGAVEDALDAYVFDHAIDLIVMGAYGHSRIREFLVGSTTTHLLRTSTVPLLLLR
ncbi:MAG TPA: universal stress protein [Thiobacillus sp.]|nr:MAG: universal stress protein UspA [Hydrogenophilales bacterium 28-61-11]OYZ57275.1 MAG: universal stress protein UspA [Hydrogenophilales bacterium 16-61-112]OZA51010.1 MAG: universal stress protein UspA [Hydrogenophilales bacterium 17-61-76]HQT30723.1 universal stress protein [Thiobacillus sp.]HQT69527.1 universal stress protein [Thiobacillus sp.]